MATLARGCLLAIGVLFIPFGGCMAAIWLPLIGAGGPSDPQNWGAAALQFALIGIVILLLGVAAIWAALRRGRHSREPDPAREPPEAP